MPMKPTTLTSWALLLWNTLKEMGFDPLPIFREAGLDPAKLGDGEARYETVKMVKLWEAAVDHTGDVDIGINTGKHWSATTFHALGFAWLASSSLLDALKRLERYAKLVNNSLTAKLSDDGANYRITLVAPHPELMHPTATDAGFTAIIKMCRLLTGENYQPIAIEMMRDHRAPGALEAFAGISANYNMSVNALLFDGVTAKRELVTGNPGLVEANEHIAIDYLRHLNSQDIVSSVKSKIIDLLPSGQASEENIAEKLNIQLRTMQRKLKQEGYSYKHILNSTRQEIAHNYIRNSRLSLTEIAYLLGFADQANFTRAFRRWTGSSPSEHRKLITQQKVANM